MTVITVLQVVILTIIINDFEYYFLTSDTAKTCKKNLIKTIMLLFMHIELELCMQCGKRYSAELSPCCLKKGYFNNFLTREY